ncbi:MAG: PhoH family protein [Chlamydiota bacterium]
MKKTFVLDTNVLLHDPHALKNFGSHKVIIPMIVLEELDGMKRQSNALGNNARSWLRYIGALKAAHGGDFDEGIDIPEGPHLRIHFENRTEKLKTFPLPLDRNTNKILLACHLLKSKGEQVVFVSKDFVSRVKAEAMQIPAEDYENMQMSYANLPQGIAQFNVSKREMDEFFKDGLIPRIGEEFEGNEYCLLRSEERSSALCKYSVKAQKFSPLREVPKDVLGIRPLNAEQKCAIDLLLSEDISLVALVGQAGTGKTLLALACGMHQVFHRSTYNRMLVSRPIVPLGKDIGYLPGTKEEKLFHWMQPIYDNLKYLTELTAGFGNGDASMDFILGSNEIEIEAFTYIRGRTLPQNYMIVDEAQNLTQHEIKTVITRAGHGTKVILTGDPTQIDHPYLDKDSNGLTYAITKFRKEPLFGHMILEKTERSELAKVAAKIL